MIETTLLFGGGRSTLRRIAGDATRHRVARALDLKDNVADGGYEKDHGERHHGDDIASEEVLNGRKDVLDHRHILKLIILCITRFPMAIQTQAIVRPQVIQGCPQFDP